MVNMSTTTETKLKMEKSSKKRNIDDSNDDPARNSKSLKTQSESLPRKSSISEDISSSPPPSKKRKTSVSEIEVDITAPEPPSKRALRLLKKGKPLPIKAPSPEPSTPKTKKPEFEKRSEHGIWIGNLSYSTSKADLLTFFTSNSSISESSITRIHMPNPADQKSVNRVSAKKQHNSGFAYVDFLTAEAVSEAIELSEELLAGRRVLIKDNKSFEGRPAKTKEESRSGGKPPNKRIFVGNLRFDTTKESLREHFEKCGPIDSAFVATFEDSGKCKGYGWITFAELEGAVNAVQGWVMVPKEEQDDTEDEDESDSEDEQDGKEEKKPKMRKWWVNRIHREPVRLEFAEDAQVRYKKRYGKDGSKARVDGDGNDVVQSVKNVEYSTPEIGRLTGGIVKSQGKRVVF